MKKNNSKIISDMTKKWQTKGLGTNNSHSDNNNMSPIIKLSMSVTIFTGATAIMPTVPLLGVGLLVVGTLNLLDTANSMFNEDKIKLNSNREDKVKASRKVSKFLNDSNDLMNKLFDDFINKDDKEVTKKTMIELNNDVQSLNSMFVVEKEPDNNSKFHFISNKEDGKNIDPSALKIESSYTGKENTTASKEPKAKANTLN